MRPILALNCLLQIEQERSEEESYVGDALALAFCFAHFCLALLVLFSSYSPAPLLMRPHHLFRSCAICSHDSVSDTTKTCLYNFDPPKTPFSYIKTGVYRDIHNFSFAQKHRLWGLI